MVHLCLSVLFCATYGTQSKWVFSCGRDGQHILLAFYLVGLCVQRIVRSISSPKTALIGCAALTAICKGCLLLSIKALAVVMSNGNSQCDSFLRSLDGLMSCSSRRSTYALWSPLELMVRLTAAECGNNNRLTALTESSIPEPHQWRDGGAIKVLGSSSG